MNDFDLGLNALDYEIWFCVVRIGGAELSKSANLAKRGITYVDVPITFRPKDFGLALWDMIRGMGTGYTIKGNINVDTPFGAMKLPIVKEGGTTRLKKNKEDGGDDDDDEEWRGMLGWQVKLVVDVVCLSVLVLENNRQTGT